MSQRQPLRIDLVCIIGLWRVGIRGDVEADVKPFTVPTDHKHKIASELNVAGNACFQSSSVDVGLHPSKILMTIHCDSDLSVRQDSRGSRLSIATVNGH